MHRESNLLDFIEKIGIHPSKINNSVFSSIINAPQSHYRTFHIPKRKGGVRVITSPYPTLNHIQKILLKKYIEILPVHPRCFAYVKDRNVIKHAEIHLGCSELLTLDIESFFPSITRQMVFEALAFTDINEHFISYISFLCTFNNGLPQGACTSPALSNAVFKPIDHRLYELAKSLGLEYSRYADDLAFSGKHVPRNLYRTIEKILNEHKLHLNSDKTKLKIAGAKKILTGVSISNNELKAPKSFKRSLRAQVYELEKQKNNLFGMTNFDPLIYEKTLGKLNYLLQIEPENTYALDKKQLLIQSYKELMTREII